MDINHEVTCQTCLCQVRVNYMYQIIGGNEDEYKLKTEFEVCRTIITAYKKNGLKCPICSSGNIQPLNIKVNNYKLFDFDRIANRWKSTNEQMFMIFFTKIDNVISSQLGGRRRGIKMPFIISALKDISKRIQNIDNNEFVKHTKGNFCFCYTGDYDFDTTNAELQLERLYYFGFSKDEILTALQKELREALNNV